MIVSSGMGATAARRRPQQKCPCLNRQRPRAMSGLGCGCAHRAAGVAGLGDGEDSGGFDLNSFLNNAGSFVTGIVQAAAPIASSLTQRQQPTAYGLPSYGGAASPFDLSNRFALTPPQQTQQRTGTGTYVLIGAGGLAAIALLAAVLRR